MHLSQSERLRKARNFAKLTQAELAKRASLTPSAIGNIEAGSRGFGSSVLQIASACGVNPYWLVSGSGEMLLLNEHVLLQHMNASSPLGASALTLFDALDLLLKTRSPALQTISRSVVSQWNSGEITSIEAANMLDAIDQASKLNQT